MILKTKRNKKIAKMREEGCTFQFIADKYKISRQRAHQIVNRINPLLINQNLSMGADLNDAK